MDHLRVLTAENERFRAALDAVDADAPVPSCPDWSAADLVWHLTEVQWTWATIVIDRHVEDPGDVTLAGLPSRPAAMDEHLRVLAGASARLEDALHDTPPATPVWTWADGEGDVAWVRRRMAHEVLVHRYDAELAAGTALTPPRPEVAADGIDELLSMFLLGVPGWAAFSADGRTVIVETDDTGDRWGLALGRMTGTSPVSGRSYDLPAATAATPTVEEAGARLRAPAAGLHAWLWGRGDGQEIVVDGDGSLRDAVRELAADATA